MFSLYNNILYNIFYDIIIIKLVSYDLSFIKIKVPYNKTIKK